MKKIKIRKGLACLLAMVMTVAYIPAGALAAEDDAAGTETPVCTCEAACTEDSMNTDCPVCGAEGAALENCGKYQAPEQNDVVKEPEAPADREPTAAEQVQTLIDALPTVDELTAMGAEEQGTVYEALQAAYDAYNALTDAEKQEVTGAEIFDALFGVFNGMVDTLEDAVFNVTGGDPNNDYSIEGTKLTIKTSTSLTVSCGTSDSPITGQIVIAENVNANLTLDGVHIEGVAVTIVASAKSAIELSSNSTLTLTLATNSDNTLKGGSGNGSGGATGPAGPGIHVPQNATLTVLCAGDGGSESHICGNDESNCGKLTITGGSSTSDLGGVGIGGDSSKANSGSDAGSYTGQPCGTVLLLGGDITVTGGTGVSSDQARDIGGSNGSGANGGACGTVIILTTVKRSEGTLNIGGGITTGSGVSAGDNGAGIKPGTGDNTYEVYGSTLTLPDDLTIPAGVTLNIPSNATLTVPDGKTLTNYGIITGTGKLDKNSSGSFINYGSVNVTTNNFNNNSVFGAFNVIGGTKDTDFSFGSGVLTIKNNANLTISMAPGVTTPNSDRIVVAENATATITLDGVQINAPTEKSAIELLSSSNLTLILPAGTESSLVGGTQNSSSTENKGGAGIRVPSDATLNIKCSESDNTHTCESSSCGKLSAEGKDGGAGIGGVLNGTCGTVTIEGGNVTATSDNAAGIGGGNKGTGGDVTINGGIVTAAGGPGGAGIGGAGENGLGGNITITGGIVTATGDGGAAGIGGGWHSDGGTVIITGGIVTATLVTTGGGDGAGIGGGTGAGNGSFSTNDGSTTGNAVIFASSNISGNEIGDDDDTSSWSGVIFQGKIGRVYGNVTLTDSFTVPNGYILMVPSGSKLTIPDNLTITNNGTIMMVDDGELTPTNKVTGNAAQQNYTVTFNVGEHGVAPGNKLVYSGHVCPKPDNPTAEGYTFVAWYKDENFQTLWNFDTDTVTAPMTLYAMWVTTPVEQTYSVTVEGGTGSGDYTVGTIVTITATVPSGKVFTGWTITPSVTFTSGNANTSTATFNMPNSDVTVTANFKDASPQPAEYTITFDGNGGTSPAAQTTTGQKLTSLPTSTQSGYSFNGWYTAKTGGDKITLDTVFSASVTVYAQWTKNGGDDEDTTYPPVIGGTTGGTVELDNPSPKPGDKVTITPKPEDGKEVDRVIVTDENGKEITVTDNGDGTYSFVQPDGRVTIKVTFKTEETKPVTDEKSPQTGDDSNITLWLAVLLMSGVGVVSTIIYGRKRKKAK